MATISVSVQMPENPQGAWDKASALDRFDEWMTIHGGWCSPPPKKVGKGTEVESLVKVKGFKNTLRNHQRMPDGSLRDTVVFSIIESEWPAVRNELRRRTAR